MFQAKHVHQLHFITTTIGKCKMMSFSTISNPNFVKKRCIQRCNDNEFEKLIQNKHEAYANETSKHVKFWLQLNLYALCAHYCTQTKTLVEMKPLVCFDAKTIIFTLIRHFPDNLFCTHKHTHTHLKIAYLRRFVFKTRKPEMDPARSSSNNKNESKNLVLYHTMADFFPTGWFNCALYLLKCPMNASLHQLICRIRVAHSPLLCN